jgi:hypothetical protein
MPHSPEWYEKRDICRFLDRLGPDLCSYVKHTTAGYGKSGNGDFTVNLIGAYWNVEAKRPGTAPTAVQQRRGAEVIRAQGWSAAGTAEVVIKAMTDWLATRGIVV